MAVKKRPKKANAKSVKKAMKIGRLKHEARMKKHGWSTKLLGTK